MAPTKNIGSVTMPAGEYWVGDPCYSVPNDKWIPWLEAADYENERRYLLADIDGFPVLGISTANGDGTFYDEQGRQYPVDAGLIGLVPTSFGPTLVKDGTFKHTWSHDFECSYDEAEGIIDLGGIHIDTDPDDSPWED